MDIASILVYIALGIISAIGGVVLALLKKLKALVKGTQSLLKSELYAMYQLGMKRGYTSLMEKNIFTSLYDQYHALGKNGSMTACYKQYMALPIKIGKDDAKSI